MILYAKILVGNKKILLQTLRDTFVANYIGQKIPSKGTL